MRNTKKGFTLVELIVVITILAILGTIAFISLGSYTADARNAKRLDGISKLATAIDNGTISGVSLLAYVTADTSNNADAVSVGGTGATLITNYQAGDVNGSALKVKEEQFQDPSSNDSYKIGVSTKAGGVYELAAKVEDGTNKKSVVKGNYDPRATTAKTTSTGSSTVKLANVADINFFKVGDDTTNGVISKISADGLTLTVAGTPAVTIALAATESDGLISSSSITDSSDGFVTNDSTTIFPY